MAKQRSNQNTHDLRLARRDKAKRDSSVNLDNWMQILQSNRMGNITGKPPQLKAKLGGVKTNREYADDLNKRFDNLNPDTGVPFSLRQANKIRNYRKSMPKP